MTRSGLLAYPALVRRSCAGLRAEKAFRDWALEHAIPLEPDRLSRIEVERLAPLDALLEGKRIAFIGESHHFVHEKYGYRELLARWLVSRGWRWFGEEMGWSDGLRVDRFVETGDPRHLDRVTIYGYQCPRRYDRPSGVLADSWSSFPEREFRAEQIRFATALRRLSESRPPATPRLRFFGIDVDYVPGGAYEDVEERLARTDDPIVVALRKRVAPVEGESLEREIERLAGVLHELEDGRGELEFALGAQGLRDVRHSLRVLRESLSYAKAAYSATDWRDLVGPMAAREQTMQWQVDEVLACIGERGKVALFSHNQHLARDDSRIRAPGIAPGGGRVPSIGNHIARRHPREVFSVWLLLGRGRDNQPLRSLRREVSSPRGSLNEALCEIGPAFVLPTASADPRARCLRSSRTRIASMYGQSIRAALAEQTDAILFVRDATPLRE